MLNPCLAVYYLLPYKGSQIFKQDPIKMVAIDFIVGIIGPINVFLLFVALYTAFIYRLVYMTYG